MDTYINVITLILSSTPILYPISNELREIFNRSPTLALHGTLPLLLSVQIKKILFKQVLDRLKINFSKLPFLKYFE